MKKFIKSFFIVLLIALLTSPHALNLHYVFADDGQKTDIYYVYDEKGNFLIQKSGVLLNDTFLTKDFTEWTIISINGNVAIAKKGDNLNKPKINVKSSVSSKTNDKQICLYLTHNDESYTPSDGYDSIYGAGGIHDVAKDLKEKLSNLGINVVLNETLHIPHDSKAYVRSKTTATNLQSSYNPDGLFDIHRDGVSRSLYYTEYDGKPYSKIRIVVGKSNPYFEENYAFAKEIFSVGQALYPWLFLDIYCGSGKYNQNIQEHALLFEMGTYLIEKDLVLSSTPYLANVINTVLYNTENEENGDISIDEDHVDDLEKDYVDQNTATDNSNTTDTNNDNNSTENGQNNEKNNKKSVNSWLIPLISIVLTLGIIASISLYFMKKQKGKKDIFS